jgi:hypothetical protein
MQLAVLDRRDDLHPAIEVARHPVRRPEVDLLVAVVPEIEDSRMLEKAPDDARHLDAIADSGNSRAQATNAADDKIDIHASLRRVVEVLDKLRVDE